MKKYTKKKNETMKVNEEEINNLLIKYVEDK